MSRTTHRGDCSRCGASSPRYPTSAEAHRWITEHRGTCTRTRTAKPAINLADVDELVARATKLKPLNPSMNSHAPVRRHTPKRVDLDAWGRSSGGGVRWTGANCLRASIANLLGAADLERVPAPVFTGTDWLSDYSDQLAETTGYRIEEEPTHVFLANRNAGKCWIAGIYEPDGDANHAIVARGNLVYHDPAGLYSTLPLDRVMYGMRLVPADSPEARPLGRCGEVTLRGRPDHGATLTVDLEAELRYPFWTNRSSSSTRRLYLIGHHATGRRTACSLAGCFVEDAVAITTLGKASI
jgi:hypothetical protein